MTQLNWISSKVAKPKISRALLLEAIHETDGAEVSDLLRQNGYIIVSRRRFDELNLAYQALTQANRQGYLVEFLKNHPHPSDDTHSHG